MPDAARGETPGPLWSQDRIYEAMDVATFDVLSGERIHSVVTEAYAQSVLETMRDEYETALATLRARVATLEQQLTKLLPSGRQEKGQSE